MQIIDCNTLFGAWPSLSVDVSLDCLLKLMDQAGIDRALTCSTTGIFYLAEKGNRETLEVCDKYDRLLPTAVINPHDLIKEGEIAKLKQREFIMLRLYPEAQGWPAIYHPLENVFRQCAENDFPMMIRLPRLGFATQLLPLIEKYPVKIILSPGNYPLGFLPEILSIAKAYPNVLIETRVLATPQASKIFSELDPGKVCFGTGMPLYYPQSQWILMDNFDIDEDGRGKIYSGNIKTTTGIE